jgi:hypothetical protein
MNRFFFAFNKQKLYLDTNDKNDLRRHVREYDQNRK